MNPVTYAGLLDHAAMRIADGALAVRRRRFDTYWEATDVIVDFHESLAALGKHVRTLFGPTRLTEARWWTRQDPVARAALGLDAAILRAVHPDMVHPDLVLHPERPWADAATHLRAASDLLATQFTRSGQHRSPDAALILDTAARATALGRVGQLAGMLLAAEEPLALRAGQAGIPWTQVRRWLPPMPAASTWAAELATVPTADTDAVGRVRLIGEEPRSDDPVGELGDRLHRLRQSAWALAAHPDHSIATLRDLAGAALMIHAHTAAAHGADLTRTTPDPPPPAARPYLARAGAWRAVHVDLTDYLSEAPTDPQIHTDTLALRHLLTDLAPLTGQPPAAGRVRDALTAAAGVTTDLATSSATAFNALASTGHVHQRAASLTREQTGDDVALIRARLTAVHVRAPQARTDISCDLYIPLTQPITPRPGAVLNAPPAARDLATVPAISRIGPERSP